MSICQTRRRPRAHLWQEELSSYPQCCKLLILTWQLLEIVLECRAEEKGEIFCYCWPMTAKCFFLRGCWTRLFSSQREGKKNDARRRNGERGRDWSCRVLNIQTCSHTVWLVRATYSRTEVTPFNFQDSGLNFAFC